MDHRHELSVCVGMAAVCAEFSRAKGRYEGAGAGDARVAVCGVGGDEFVWVAAEGEARFAYEVKEGELVVWGSLMLVISAGSTERM